MVLATISAGKGPCNFVKYTRARSPAEIVASNPIVGMEGFLSVLFCQVEVSVMGNCSKLFYRVIIDETELQRFTIQEEI
jgi:hypothetical protein